VFETTRRVPLSHARCVDPTWGSDDQPFAWLAVRVDGGSLPPRTQVNGPEPQGVVLSGRYAGMGVRTNDVVSCMFRLVERRPEQPPYLPDGVEGPELPPVEGPVEQRYEYEQRLPPGYPFGRFGRVR
jgi:hypothetical protein